MSLCQIAMFDLFLVVLYNRQLFIVKGNLGVQEISRYCYYYCCCCCCDAAITAMYDVDREIKSAPHLKCLFANSLTVVPGDQLGACRDISLKDRAFGNR